MHHQQNFNSIKVRLKHIDPVTIGLVGAFQFHKGTIKTSPNAPEIRPYNAFQFHKGTIKTVVSVDTTIINHEFQFHKGTIKT